MARQVEEGFARRLGRGDQTTETAARLAQVAHLVGELAETQVGFVTNRGVGSQAVELLARLVQPVETQQRIGVGESMRLGVERRGFLGNGDGGDRISLGGQHARQLRARIRGGRIARRAHDRHTCAPC